MYEIIAHTGETTNDGFFDNMMGGDHYSNDGGYALLWMFFLMIGIAALIVLFLSFMNKNGQNSQVDYEEALTILRNRYARGEVTKKQFEEIKKDLS